MKQTVRLGRVGGIPLGAHWSVGVVLAIIAEVLAVSVLPAAYPHQRPAVYWAVGAIAAVLFLASLLAHELAHALVARRSGVTVKSVTLWMLGGVTEFETEPPTPRADFWIAAAGPLASLAAGAVFYGVGAAIHTVGGPAIVVAAAGWLAVMNGILGMFNLLPGAPLDGGRVLRAALWRRWGNWARAERAAVRGGRVLGTVIAGLGVAEMLFADVLDGLWLVLIGWFVLSAAGAEGQTATAQAALAGVRVADVMTPDPELASGWVSIAEFVGQATHSRQEAFPVVGLGGELTGVVLASQFERIPASNWAQLRVDQVAVPVPPAYRATPDDPAAPLAKRTPLGGEVAAVVLAGGRVTGMVTSSDLQQALHWQALARTHT